MQTNTVDIWFDFKNLTAFFVTGYYILFIYVFIVFNNFLSIYA